MPLPCVLRGLGPLAGSIALLSVLVADGGAPALATPVIAPHTAVYKLELGKTKGGQAVTHASGRIEFKWSEGCDGWTVSQRTLMVLSNSQGRDIQTSWTLDAWESKDGRDLKAQELPGLWNGAMANWNTLFVEVPIITFNPVKTVNDLLRANHQ